MSTRPPLGCSVPNMVQRYLGTEYDKVKSVADNIDYVKDVAEGIKGLPVVSYIGDAPPTRPMHGAEWYCTTDGRSYVWYKDVDSSQWVESSPQSTLETDAHKTRVAAMGGVINASIASVHAITDNVTISSISGGFDGQEITLVNVTGANVIVNQAGNMRMVGGTFTMTPDATLKFICATTTWFEVSRSSNN